MEGGTHRDHRAERRTVVVERGVLRGFFYNTAVAHRAGVESTGNASRGGFASLPGIGPHNFHMAAGAGMPRDVVAATARGLWLRDVTGYGINAVNGNFSGGAEGLWIEEGKIAFPVKAFAASAAALPDGLEFTYESEARAIAVLDKRIRVVPRRPIGNNPIQIRNLILENAEGALYILPYGACFFVGYTIAQDHLGDDKDYGEDDKEGNTDDEQRLVANSHRLASSMQALWGYGEFQALPASLAAVLD